MDLSKEAQGSVSRPSLAAHDTREQRVRKPNPDPMAVERMAYRFGKGLNLWTGEKLSRRDAVGWRRVRWGDEKLARVDSEGGLILKAA